jgi:integrase
MKKTRQKVKPNVYRIVMLDPKTGKKHEPDLPYEASRRVRGPGINKREWRCFRTLSAACKFSASTEEVAEELTFAALWKVFEENELVHLESSTRVNALNKSRHLRFFDQMVVNDITPLAIDSWIAHVKAPAYLEGQKSTRLNYRHEMKLLKQVLHYYRSRFDGRYPMPVLPKHLERSKVKEKPMGSKKDLSLTEFEAFLSALKSITAGTPYECLPVMAQAQYGIYGRIQEAAALFCEDLDPSTGKVLVRRKILWPRKAGLEVEVKQGLKRGQGKVIVSKFTTQLLREWMLKSGIREGMLFALDGKPVPYRAIQHYYDRAFEIAKLPHRGTHIVRHAALTEHYATCRDIRQTQLMAGHRDLATTQIYAKVREEVEIETQGKMDEKLRAMTRS